MTEFEKWNSYFKQGFCTVDDLKLPLSKGIITIVEYNTITGKELTVDDIKQLKLDVIREYKWEVSERPFIYDNYYQPNLQRDKNMMFDCMIALQNSIVPSIQWKISDTEYKTITDALYFLNMKAMSTMLVEKSFGVEDAIAREIKALSTVEELNAYDEIAKFDELFAK